MNNLLKFLNTFGIPVDESTSSIILLSSYYLVLSIFSLLNVINICLYLFSIFLFSNEKLLSQIPENYVFIHKLIKFYINIRIGYIIFEVILLLFLISLMIIISFGIVSFYFQNK